ncbi:hypothetical protein PQX77_017074 [Marasmius sp. AFHP31]|nr:hypothetical protein PQX77_017074 [Marasmius sp. AFHP31]
MCVLVSPRQLHDSISQSLYEKIIIHFATRFETTVAKVRKYYRPDMVEQWSKVRRLGGGDDMKASSMDIDPEDKRDATFVRYDMLIDVNTRYKRRKAVFQPKAFYGQLQHIFVVRFPATRALKHYNDETYILAYIHTCEGMTYENGLEMPYYTYLGGREVVDMGCVQCLVGRIKLSDGWWAIVDRSGEIQRAYYTGDDGVTEAAE